MSLVSNHHRNLIFSDGLSPPFRELRRRRLKLNRRFTFVPPSSSLSNQFHDLIVQFPLNLIVPAIGFGSLTTLYLTREKIAKKSSKILAKFDDFGEWILFTSPTPFNRFVILRCPSIAIEGEDDSLRDVNEKLVKNESHYLKPIEREYDVERESEVEYRRMCVGTDDGGVISMDWLASLELKEEHGLDTTVLIVPGTVEGSGDENVKRFVLECLKRGCFPVVMNPRGCAGSPLTTARLFTAADSDDVCTAIKFINNARPWTTLMGVGWGYGANMLTKYLGEVGEKTPLTAATCIDNPFDLEEAARSSIYNTAFNKKLTDGLIDILRSNKELFYGKTKRFDVEKALLAKSVMDFEKAISMVSYGFNAIEDFYSKSSTQDVIGNVKIPLLFIQNDDGAVPMFSVPRSMIAENPYTSLLFSSSPSKVISSSSSVRSWCQHCTIEWLMAVELGLLKGRHPLLQDLDIAINPSAGLARVEDRPSGKVGRANGLLQPTQLNVLNGYLINKMQEGDDAVSVQIPGQNTRRNMEQEGEGPQQPDNDALPLINSADTESVKDDEVPEVDNETGQMLQTAQVVMKMLDVTMPNTLAEEQKKKVLTAVGRGETLMNALQEAVPEEVRGKLKVAVSEILQSQRTNLKLDGLLRTSKVPSLLSGKKSDIHENAGDLSSEGSLQKDPSDQNERVAESDDNSSGMNQPSENSQTKSRSRDGDESAKGNNSYDAGPNDTGPLANSKEHQNDVDHNGGVDGLDTEEEKNIQNSKERSSDLIDEKVDESLSPEEDAQLHGNDNQKIEDENSQPVSNEVMPVPSDSSSPTFGVSQALNELAGMDDSTQVAVNSVFGVIENMIDHLEGETDNQNETMGIQKSQEKKTDSIAEALPIINDEKMEKQGNRTIEPDILHDSPAHDTPENQMGLRMEATKKVDEKPTQNSNSYIENGTTYSDGNNTANLMETKQEEKMKRSVASKLLVENSDRDGHVTNVPSYKGIDPFGESFNNEHFQNYPLSKLPNSKSLDIDTTTALLLDYIPEDRKWKLSGNAGDSNHDTTPRGVDQKFQAFSNAQENDTDKIMEPSYVILDTKKQQLKPAGWSQMLERGNRKDKIEDYGQEEMMLFVKNSILETLKVEVSRRLNAGDMKEMEYDLAKDMEQVSNAVFLAVQYDKDQASFHIMDASEKVGIRQRDRILKAISFAVHDTTCLRKVLPFGVIVASTLAALKKTYIVTKLNDVVHSNAALNLDQVKLAGLETLGLIHDTEINHIAFEKSDQNSCLDTSTDKEMAASKNVDDDIAMVGADTSALDTSTDKEMVVSKSVNGDILMVGAVTSALGASALFSQQQEPCNGDESGGNSSKAFNHQNDSENLEGASEKHHDNVVMSLAEKAMSVAAPVIPKKEGGELDQERLVAMLAEWGQKGGLLRLVGKLALLWGGIRGAMSLTDKLIMFLRIAERPLFQRIFAFVGMVLVLWSPVVVPLLPTLVQGWATHNSSKFAEFTCIVGLYVAIMTLVMLWGKRIRGYDNPLEKYGLDFVPSLKTQNFVKAFIGGAMIVLSVQSVNALLGCVSVAWPSKLPYSSLFSIPWFKSYGKIGLLVSQGFLIATAVALVEELLFRSWLPAEIATDLGYQQGIILSGLAFSLLQRSPQAIPGLWLLSLGLAGARERSQGSLSVPIGLRSGIMTASFILQTGGFVTYHPILPLWVTGIHPFQPFSGLVGFSFALIMAVVFYPRQPDHSKKITRSIRD